MLFWLLVTTLLAGSVCTYGAVRCGERHLVRFGVTLIVVVITLFLVRWLSQWLAT